MEIHPRYVGSALVSDLNRIQGLMLGYVPWWLKDLDLRGGPPGSSIHGGITNYVHMGVSLVVPPIHTST